MACLLAAVEPRWYPLAWTALALFGFLGGLALVSPRWFVAVVMRNGRMNDSDAAGRTSEAVSEVDRQMLSSSRRLGAAVLGAVAIFAVLLVSP